MNETRIRYLLQRYAEQVISKEERAELIALVNQAVHSAVSDETVRLILAEAENLPDPSLSDEAVRKFIRDVVAVDQSLTVSTPPTGKLLRRIPGWRRWSWAAAILVIFGIGAYLYSLQTGKNSKTASVVKVESPDSILPGRERAVLTLADGSTIALDSTSGGAIARQGAVNIVATEDGALEYEVAGQVSDQPMMNKIETPRGGQFKIKLPDGTDVWLNAGSSIRYPAAFVQAVREVEVSGEVYFEVAKDKQKPFAVMVDGRERIEVLGTHFNVNAYSNAGAIKTTLLEGQIKLKPLYHLSRGSTEAYIMRPGQQVQLSDQVKVLDDINTEQVMAWKNGFFDFTGADFEAVMNDIERWYDIQVRYEGKVPAMKLQGRMDRGVQLSGVIRFLKDYGLKVKQEDRTLRISQ